QPGPSYGYYKRLASQVASGVKETSVFDGIDTTITGLFATLKHPAPANAPALLEAIRREVDAGVKAFRMEDPSAVVRPLARGLAATRDAVKAFAADPEAVRILEVKEQQFADAINTALGIDFSAVAQPAGLPEPSGPGAAFAPPPTMGPLVPDQMFEVKWQFTNRGSIDVEGLDIAVVGDASAAGAWPPVTLKGVETSAHTVTATLRPDVPYSAPYFSRSSIVENRYTIRDAASRHLAAALPAVRATARYTVAGVPVNLVVPVTRREAQLPYGSVMRELTVVPQLALTVSPRQAIVPQASAARNVRLQVELTNNAPAASQGELTL